MRIAYVAKHDSGGNDDEGAITHALTELGHEVIRLPEAIENPTELLRAVSPNLLLFHKWENCYRPSKLSHIPSVFWYFDLVQCPDPTLERRCRNRVAWMNRAIREVDLGFCTDGDWVAGDKTGKLVWLPQGADERVIGRGDLKNPYWARPPHAKPQILFTGISKGGGSAREAWVKALKQRYGHRFTHIQHGSHGRDLANLIAVHTVLVCPDAPTTERYWSNRVYNACGFGACVIHPYCGETLHQQYQDEHHLRYYQNWDHLYAVIDHYLNSPSEAVKLGEVALEHTRQHHLYRHRCETLLQTCKERGLIK